MAVDFSTELYLIAFDKFARPITVTPVVSQPGAPAYGARGYFDTKETDVLTEANAILSSSQSFLDIRQAEFTVEPLQGDIIDIPFHANVDGGTYEVLDLAGKGNAGGIITISLRELGAPLPDPPP
jgi:hypothetical protein